MSEVEPNAVPQSSSGRDPQSQLIAYRIGDWPPMRLVPATARRAWMDQTPHRFAYRCLPLVIANQAGWFVLNSHRVTAVWSGGAEISAIQFETDGPDRRCPASSHFGSGIITFCLPWLFRTPPGWNLHCRGPANWPKDGICALEGIVETDWAFSTFTVNWQLTRKDNPVTFEENEPIAMLMPSRRSELEQFVPEEQPMHSDIEVTRGFEAWSGSRAQFLQQLQKPGTDAATQGWQKDYTLGRETNGTPVSNHQTRLSLRPFTI